MKPFLLPGTDKPYELRPNLAFVIRMEDMGGNIFKMAEQLLHGELALNDVLLLLSVAYAAAGYQGSKDALTQFLSEQSPISPAQLLSDIFVEILTPLYTARAIEIADENARDNKEGKPQAVRAAI